MSKKVIEIQSIQLEIDEKTKNAALYLYGGGKKFMLKQSSADIAQDYLDPLHVVELTEVYAQGEVTTETLKEILGDPLQ